MIDELWQSLIQKASLPCNKHEYWDQQGPMQVICDSRRRYHRFFFRGKAIAYTNQGDFAVYLKDLSRMGIGFYSPAQLFPCDEIQLELPERKHLTLRITRCTRLKNGCFDCGSVFLNSTAPTF